MANKIATLFGVVELIREGGDYDLNVNGANLNTITQNVVRVIVDTSKGDYTLNLPSIASFKGFWNPQIMIVDIATEPRKVTIKADKTSTDLINGKTNNFVLGNSRIATLTIGYNRHWAGLGVTAE